MSTKTGMAVKETSQTWMETTAIEATGKESCRSKIESVNSLETFHKVRIMW